MELIQEVEMPPIPFPWLETTMPNLFWWVSLLTLSFGLALAAGGLMFVVGAGLRPTTRRGGKDARDARLGFALIACAIVTWVLGYYLIPLAMGLILISLVYGLVRGTIKALGD